MPSKINLDESKIISLYKSGMFVSDIAREMAVSVPTIKRRLRINKVRKDPKYSLNELSFSQFTPQSCYWAGFLAADAWVGSNHKKKKIYINLAETDIGHLRKMCDFLDRERSAVRKIQRFKWGKTYNQCVLEIGNRKIVEDLVSNFNVVQKKSFILQPPLNIPSSLIKHYIRGYFDGDGCISKCGGFNIVSGSKLIINWIRDNINDELRIFLNIYNRINMHSIQTSSEKAKQIFGWLYSDSTEPMRLDRKYNKYLRFIS